MKPNKKGVVESLGKNFIFYAILLLILAFVLAVTLIGPSRYQIYAYIDKVTNFNFS